MSLDTDLHCSAALRRDQTCQQPCEADLFGHGIIRSRVPAVYLGSAFLSDLYVLSERRMSNLCGLNTPAGFESPLPHQDIPFFL